MSFGYDDEDAKLENAKQEQKLVIEATTLKEAIEAASKQWGIPCDDLRAEVVGSERGFLGLFGNKLSVEVRPIKPLILYKSVDFTNRVLNLMGMDATASIEENGTIEIKGQDAPDYIVRRYGDCLKAIEYLLNLALRDPGSDPRIRMDSCGYRERRTRSLERLAEATARQVAEYGRPIRLEPMLSWERWVIHTVLKGREDVRTESVGEPPLRKVVIMPKFDTEHSGSYRSRPRPGSRFPRDSRGGSRGGYNRDRYRDSRDRY